MKDHTKPLPYAPVPFHAVRAISLLSSVIVAGILGYFCHALVSDGFKIPWTFIIVFLAAILSIVALLLTSIIMCCASLNPIFNMLINIVVFIMWIIGISILTWNMYGALGHSCSITNWGNSRGVMVCNIYKLLYSFVFFGSLSQVAQIVLDVRARRAQLALGKYDKMMETQDLKSTENLQPLAPHSLHDVPPASFEPSSHQTQFRDDQSQYQQEFRDEIPGWRPGQKPVLNHSQSYASSVSTPSHNNSYYHGSQEDQYRAYEDPSAVQMQDFAHHRAYQPTHYDSRGYNNHNNGGEYGYQQETYYQGRY